MESDKPRISILMAVYEPRMDWLREQLESLNAQTYPRLRLYIRDDCSPTVPFGEIQALVARCIKAFPYSIARNAQNLGSNGTFERLTQEAEGDYFAYCDQDDVWLPEKLDHLELRLAEKKAVLSYCDMSAMGDDGSIVAKSLREVRPRLRYLEGTDLGEAYFFRNCTAGCSMLIEAAAAKAALPFPGQTVCDQWLAIVGAVRGAVVFVDEPLVRYRQHKGNQTGILSGVTDKGSYLERRVLPMEERFRYYLVYAAPSSRMEEFVRGRLAGNVFQIWRNRSFSPHEAWAEIALRLLPERVFQKCLEMGR